MFPYGYTTDALFSGNLFIAKSVGETETEDALLLCRQMAGDELVDVCESFVFLFEIVRRLSTVTFSNWNRCMTQLFEASVADTSHEVVFRCLRHQDRMSVKQACKDVAHHILAFLLVVECCLNSC